MTTRLSWWFREFSLGLITVTLHEGHCVSNHRQLDCLLLALCEAFPHNGPLPLTRGQECGKRFHHVYLACRFDVTTSCEDLPTTFRNLTSRRHTDIWSHPSHYRVYPYTSSWSPKDHCHGHEWLLFVQCQLVLLFLRYGCFKIWPWKSKVKGMAKVNPNDFIWCLEFNRYVCFSFRGNRAIFCWDMANFIFDLENLRSRSWPSSNLMVTFKA